MKKLKVKEKIYSKHFGGDMHPIKVKDLPPDLQPEDTIEIYRDEGFYSENESWDPFTELRIFRDRDETDDESNRRKEKWDKYLLESNQKRYKEYLILKNLFEPSEKEVDPSKVIEIEPVMIKENSDEPINPYGCKYDRFDCIFIGTKMCSKCINGSKYEWYFHPKY